MLRIVSLSGFNVHLRSNDEIRLAAKASMATSVRRAAPTDRPEIRTRSERANDFGAHPRRVEAAAAGADDKDRSVNQKSRAGSLVIVSQTVRS